MNLFKKILLGLSILSLSPAVHAEPNREVQCLANAVYYEAKSESDKGKKAVAHVVMNRVKSGRFPKSVCAVISQHKQFSWFPRPNTADRESHQIATQVYNGQISDFTSGSLFFHNRSVSPRWKARRTVTIGNHIFYK